MILEFSKEAKIMLNLASCELLGVNIDFSALESLSEKQWQNIYFLAKWHGLRAVVWDAIVKLPQELMPSRALKIKWALGNNTIETIYEQQIQVYKKIKREAEKNNLKFILLKGLTLAPMYPIAAHRECGDLDIYPLGDYSLGEGILKSLSEQAPEICEKHDIFCVDSVIIELHKRLLNTRKTDIILEQKLQEQLKTKGLQHLELDSDLSIDSASAEFNLIFLFRHTCTHLAKEGYIFRQIYDWALMLKHYHNKIDKQYIINTLTEANCMELAKILTFASIKFLGLDPEYDLFNSSEPQIDNSVNKLIGYTQRNKEPQPKMVIYNPISVAKEIIKLKRNMWLVKKVHSTNFIKVLTRAATRYIKHSTK